MLRSRLPPQNYQNPYVCSISLNISDRLRLIGVPYDLTDSIRSSIENSWGVIQNEQYYFGAHEFKLKGDPWHGQGSEAVKARQLITSVLTCMAQNGWNLLQGVDVSKKGNDKDTLFFECGTPDPEVQIFATSLNMTDRIRLINAPEIISNLASAAVFSVWKQGIQKERNYCGSKELKLGGHPWWTNDGPEVVAGRVLLCEIIGNFKTEGFKLYGTIDMSIGGYNMRDLDTWIFRKVGPHWS